MVKTCKKFLGKIRFGFFWVVDFAPNFRKKNSPKIWSKKRSYRTSKGMSKLTPRRNWAQFLVLYSYFLIIAPDFVAMRDLIFARQPTWRPFSIFGALSISSNNFLCSVKTRFAGSLEFLSIPATQIGKIGAKIETNFILFFLLFLRLKILTDFHAFM